MENYLGILATIAAVSPFIGLFGTVWGIIDAFRGIGATGNASLATVAPGISEALVATAIGLVAAIPALMAYNFFQGQLKHLADRAGRLRPGIHQPVRTQFHLRGPRLPLSLDWEDWFQLCCPPYDQPEALDRFECRLPLATERALELCAELGATATWFCLGDQARRHPDLLRRIVAEGHTLALHGLTHRRAFQMDRKSWRASLQDGKALLEDLSGQPVVGYRAPEWSLRGPAADWWQDLPELGFRYDSSRVPLAVIGEPSWPRRPTAWPRACGTPPPVLWSGLPRSPLWGWGLRVLPFSLVRRALETLARGRRRNPTGAASLGAG